MGTSRFQGSIYTEQNALCGISDNYNNIYIP